MNEEIGSELPLEAWTDEADPQDSDISAEEQEPAEEPKEEPKQEPESGPKVEEKSEVTPKPEDFELKHLGEVKRVSRDEAVVLAQKGLDYDRVKGKQEELKSLLEQHAVKAEPFDAMAKELGISTDELASQMWVNFFVNKGYDADTAKEKAEIAAEKRALAREKQSKSEAEKAKTDEAAAAEKAEAAKKKDIADFVSEYPGVDPKSIPQSVWEAVNSGKSLTQAYTAYELKRVKAELDAEKQNKANSQKSIGSKASEGNKVETDPWLADLQSRF